MLKDCWNLIKENKAVTVVILIAVVVFGLYFSNFHNGLSDDNGKWGKFGDYIGGILNPIIAAFAFYLIAKTYNLQKTELEQTRQLLKISTDSQKNQVEVAAITALMSLNLTRIGMVENKINLLSPKTLPVPKKPTEQIKRFRNNPAYFNTEIECRTNELKSEIEKLQKDNLDLEEKIKKLLNGNA